MKLSINKLLIGLLFVFSITLIPTNIAKANTYIVAWNYYGGGETCLTTLDINLFVDSPHFYMVASGGVTNDSGCSGGTIRVNGRADVFGTSKNLFVGPTSSTGGGATFTFPAGGMHYIDFTGSVSTSVSNYDFTIGTLGAYIVPPPSPTLTVTATNIASPQLKSNSNLTVPSHTNVEISWASENATSCDSGGHGTGQTGAFIVSNMTSTETFNVTCKDDTPPCPTDTKICPDGVTTVGRLSPPTCNFATCPTTNLGYYYIIRKNPLNNELNHDYLYDVKDNPVSVTNLSVFIVGINNTQALLISTDNLGRVITITGSKGGEHFYGIEPNSVEATYDGIKFIN